ncbi:putative RNA recognition motif domain, nucleotide-binding alpha-beta plait domain superfamily [Helianthus annuus]|nr:putative RNA recognition motif domain, nucleotide-binding alpha-beta plait domain superfamily [Helianthus annuus]KAJ0776639.1 putative RNA recognition motif domain, nucleotide-binding alpha-beta plait domain superfamily [Helianthus annuus]KAJ0939190.1 putative RNA recognition motif domain, nucleotide-binding alpha-beta plait domain superfamily [Helianthus annuus]
MQSSTNGAVSDPQQQQSQNTAATTAAPAVVGVGPQQQQWVAMQYPAAAMVMQHHMMAPSPGHYPIAPSYMPYHPHHLHHPVAQQPQQGGGGGGGGGGENRTIWVGDLHNWMDEDYLRNCFASTGKVASIKVIRNKQTGFSEGYGFVEFFSHNAAEKVLQTYTCIAMPNTEQPFRLNWATFSMGDKRSNNGSDLSIFVGDLAADVTDTLLHETFANKYPSVKAAKVVIDANTGRSKGYGFVRFGDDGERTQAMTEMNGTYCSTRPMRIGAATPRKSSGYQQQYGSQGGYISNGGSHSDGDSNNTTIFVGGLDPTVSDEDLKQPFSQYGEIVSVKIPIGKGCGFVQFANRNNAEEALQKLNGTTIGKQTVRLSWGRNPANKQRNEFGNQWGGPYYGGHVFDGYEYAMTPPHDPSMYAAAYGGYPMYGIHQQQVS